MTEHKMIVCCTQNDAMQLQRRLARGGIFACVQKLPRGDTAHSCTWGVELAAQDAVRAEHCLHQSSVHWQWRREDDT